MKILVILTAVLFISACASVPQRPTKGVEIRNIEPTYFEKMNGKTDDTIVFATRYGEIAKEASMPEVMGTWGNPSHINIEGAFEVWRYDFEPGKTMFVYFLNNKVQDIKAQDE